MGPSDDQQLLDFARQLDRDEVPDPVRRNILEKRAQKHGTGVKVTKIKKIF